MKQKKSTRGRKPLGKEKKDRLYIFVSASVIEKLGKEEITKVSYEAINLALNKLSV
jgi:hypothetical protein